MVLPAENQPLKQAHNPPIAEENLRRDIRSLLATLGLALNQANGLDRVTIAIRDWRLRFLERINGRVNLQEVQNALILELQEILIDPLEQRGRDLRTTLEAPLLGTDGITYGTKSLRIAFSQLREEWRCRSPMNLEDTAIFTAEPHPVAGHAVRWLRDKDALIVSPDLNANYELLLDQLPQVPTRDDPRVIQLQERQAEKNMRIARERELMAQIALEEQMQVPMDENVFALNRNPELLEETLRRQIGGFLATLDLTLNASKLQDPLTAQIKDWKRLFSARIGEHANVQNAQAEFIRTLQGILLDPLEAIRDPDARITLEAPLLGSDGETYGTKSLSVCLSKIPEDLRRRSPLHFQNTADLITKPHPVAACAIQWLRNKNAHNVSVQIEAEYQQLTNENRLPVILTPEIIAREEKARIRRERMRILIEQEAEANARAAQEENRFAQALLEQQAQVIQEHLVQPMNEQIQEFAEGQDARLDRLEARDQQRILHLRANIIQFRNNINELEEANVGLRAQLVELQGDVHQLQREAIQLQIDINETKKAIEERKAGWLESLCTAALVIGACWFATWAVGGMLPSGMTANVKPMLNGVGVGVSATF